MITTTYFKRISNHLAVAWTFFILAPLTTLSAQTSAPTVFVSDGFDVITSVTIGDTVFAGADNAAPGAAYVFELRDGTGLIVAQTTATADSTGWISPVQLWVRSGVVGCDPGAQPDFMHTFRRYEDAEQILDGQHFSLYAYDAIGKPITITVPLEADTTTPRHYFSDASGCPRRALEASEQLYLSGIHMPLESRDLRFYLLKSQDPWQNGAPLEDVRSGYPDGQPIHFPGTDTTFTELVFGYFGDDCDYGYVRDKEIDDSKDDPPGDPTEPPFLLELDRTVPPMYPRIGENRPGACATCNCEEPQLDLVALP